MKTFRYTSAAYRRYPWFQIGAFLLFALCALAYFQYFSPWRGGFLHVRAAYGPVVGFLVLFLLFTCTRPVLDLLRYWNEKIVVVDGDLIYYNRIGREAFSAPLKEIELYRAGLPVTAGISGEGKRYVYKAGGRFFSFSDDIDGAEELLRMLPKS